MKYKNLVMAVLMSSAIGLGGMAYAKSEDGYRDGGACSHHEGKRSKGKSKSPEKMTEKMTKRLNLTDEQKQQVLNHYTNAKSAMEPLKNQMKSLKQQGYVLDPSAPDYMAQVNSLADQKANLARQMAVAKGQSRQQLFNILTPEQWEKMKSMKGDRKGKRGERSES